MKRTRTGLSGHRAFLRTLLIAAFAVFAFGAAWTGSPDLTMSPVQAQEGGNVPGNVLGNMSDTEFWRAIRRGVEGSVSIPDKKAGVLVQSEGDNWRAFRNGPLSNIGGWALLGVFIVLGVFYVLRGKIRVEGGLSGRTVERFNALERFSHWLTASSFVVLGLTGLNVLYGRYVLLPLIGKDAFAALTYWGKIAHNYIGFAFIAGVILMFLLFVKDNIPSRTDLRWLAMGGGMFSKGVHPPSERINAGQKILFWLVILGGLSVFLTGLSLMFPFSISLFEGTFAALNVFGFGLPTDLTMLQETQLAQVWHAVIALGLIILIIAHIYLGTLGMEGAFDAMYTGKVDENWAREHHNEWAKDIGLGGSHGSSPSENAPAE